MYNLMTKNSYISFTFNINSVEIDDYQQYLNFKGEITSYNFKKRDNEFVNDDIDFFGDNITITSVDFTLLNDNVDDILIDGGDIFFKDNSNTMILIKKDIYKNTFTNFIYELFN
jgi:hypothetical protein